MDQLRRCLEIGSWRDLYLLCEANWNEGSPSGNHKSVDPAFGVDRSGTPFKLPLFRLSSDQVVQYGPIAALPADLRPTAVGERWFPVHPEVLPQLASEGYVIGGEPDRQIDVHATASGRTVLLHGEDGFTDSYFLKLHFPKVLGRFQRPLHIRQWLAGFSVTSALRREQENLPERFGYLPEEAGLLCDAVGRPFGAISRATRPRHFPHLPSHPLLVPYHSIFGRHGPARPKPDLDYSVLGALVDIGVVPRTLDGMYETLIRPWIEAFVIMATQLGLIPECQGQNCLFAFYLDGQTTSAAVLRDLGDVFIDAPIRAMRGLPLDFISYKVIDEHAGDYYERRSFAYDSKLSRYLVLPLALAFAHILGLPENVVLDYVRVKCIDVWAASGISIEDYFSHSRTWSTYGTSANVSRHSYVNGSGPPLLR